MPTWLVIPIVVVVAIAVLALVWWWSGRARIGRVDLDRRSPQERTELDINRIQTMRTRDGMGPL